MSNGTEYRKHGAPGARSSNRAALVALATALGMAGCDALPTDPSGVADAAAEVAAVQEVWSQIPSALELEIQALAALDDDTLSGEVAADLLDAGALAAEADVALDAGAEADALSLESISDTLATKSFFAALGSTDVDAMVADVEDASETVEQRIGPTAGPEARLRLAAAAAAMARARAARAAGDRAGALLHASRAASALRWLDPEAKAKTAVAMARTMLERAERLAGAEPEPPVARALQRANDLCLAARAALDGERWHLAVTEAHACARLARAVIVRLGGGIDPEVLAERAEEAVAHAAAILERASAQAGDAPEPGIVRLLEEAERLLTRSRTALEEERWRAAIGLAGESAARSLRVLRMVHVADVPPVELRAGVAVEVALAYGARVEARIDADTPEAIVTAAARADGLVVEAQEALEVGSWRAAWGLARQAIGIYARILLALA